MTDKNTSTVASNAAQVRLNHIEFDKKALVLTGDLKKEIQRLREKYKNNERQLARLFKNVGNVAEYFMAVEHDEKYSNNVYAQCVEVSAIAICLAIEGDKSFRYKIDNASNFRIKYDINL